MGKITTRILENGYFTNWLISNITQYEFKAEMSTFKKIPENSERYSNVDYPLRKEFLIKRCQSDVVLKNKIHYKLYVPFEDYKIGFSGMLKLPFHLIAYAKSTIILPKTGEYTFKLTTCGGVTLYLNGEKAESFTPFKRNQPFTEQIKLHLLKGKNALDIVFDDLAERDFCMYFKLQSLTECPILQQVEVKDVSYKEYLNAISFVNSIRFTKDEYDNGDVKVMHKQNGMFKKIYFRINQKDYFDPSVDDINKKQGFSFVNINQQLFTKLFSVKSVQTGIKEIDVGVKLANSQIIYKHFCISIYNLEKTNDVIPENILERKKLFLTLLAESQNNDITKALARLSVYHKCDTQTTKILEKNLKIIELKGDCADFRIAPLLVIMYKYKKLLNSNLVDKINQVLIKFRFWIDENGNDCMWYFSENHALLFHLAQYLVGRMFPNKLFLMSGRTGKEQEKLGKHRLIKWFSNFRENGFDEWNSLTYIPVDLIGFFTLYIIDADLRGMAKEALNYTFNIISCNLLNDTFGSTFGRVYEKELKGYKCGEMASIIKLAWNRGFFNYNNRVPVLFSLSDYIPVAQPIVPYRDEAFDFQYRQGKNVIIHNYLTDDYSVSSVEDYHPFEKGYQEHTLNILAGKKSQASIWINHPGEYIVSGKGRPSYWAGNNSLPNVQQFRNVVLIQYRLGCNDIPFTHVYLPIGQYKRVNVLSNGATLEVNDIIIIFLTSNKIELIKNGTLKNRELRIIGKSQDILVKIIDKKELNTLSIKELVTHLVVKKNINNQYLIQDPQWGEIKFISDNKKRFSVNPTLKVITNRN